VQLGAASVLARALYEPSAYEIVTADRDQELNRPAPRTVD
jgi:hypothetical protein